MSLAEKTKIREELLQRLVLHHIGQWEEILGVMISHIAFRKNKNRPYVIQRRKERICFDKELSSLSLEAIAYCSFKAVADYGGIEKSIKRGLLEKHFPTWSTIEKIIIYAYATHDHR